MRNPWSGTASRYLYTKVNARVWPDNDPRKQYILRVSFEDYVREQKVFPIPHQPDRPWPLSLWINQIEWITDEAGNVAGDCLRLETLDDDISAYLEREIKIPHTPAMRTGTYDYRALYTPQLIRIVADTFAKDIEHFRFDLEGPAVRNTYTLK